MSKRRHEMDMTQGPLLPMILTYALPLVLSDILQLLYNAADIAVVGRFASAQALAAVSSTSSIISIFTNITIGLSMGASVLVARAWGSGDQKKVSDASHTAITLGLICGAVMLIIGTVLGKPMLKWMNSPEDVIDLASVYLLVYFSGSIFSMMFNYGAAVMRAVGDTRRPTLYLILSGLLNVVLNLIFVIFLNMNVVGVALATVISQFLSAALVVRALVRSDTSIRLEWKKLRIVPCELMEQMKIGVPVSIQKSMFSISNVILQTAVNGFGSATMAGSGAAANIEMFIYSGMCCFYTACLTFTSQNMGARKPDRMRQTTRICLCCDVVVGFVLASLVLRFAPQLVSIYSTEAEVISQGVQRLQATAMPFILGGMMDSFVASMRGMGKSLAPMLISIVGICILRILWITLVFPLSPSLYTLYLSYPVSWAVTVVAQGICYLIIRRKVFRELEAAPAA